MILPKRTDGTDSDRELAAILGQKGANKTTDLGRAGQNSSQKIKQQWYSDTVCFWKEPWFWQTQFQGWHGVEERRCNAQIWLGEPSKVCLQLRVRCQNPQIVESSVVSLAKAKSPLKLDLSLCEKRVDPSDERLVRKRFFAFLDAGDLAKGPVAEAQWNPCWSRWWKET